jgi:hypothetical protein
MSIQFDIPHTGFDVRTARPDDAKAVRMLLTELHDPAISFVATDRRRGLVIGAVAATRSCRMQPLPGPGVAVRVVEPCRRAGVGTCLLEHLEDAAVAAGAQALYAASRVDLDSDAMLAWRWLDFAPCATVEHHCLPLDQFEPRLAPLVERFRQRGRIPAAARIIPLYQADAEVVLELHLAHMGGDRDDLRRKLRGEGPGAFHPRYSRVLVVGDQSAGCILAHRADQYTAAVDANIVDPRLRGGWANVWLKLEATRGALALGIENFEFATFDHYTDTRSFTQKFGGTTTRTTVLMMRRPKK